MYVYIYVHKQLGVIFEEELLAILDGMGDPIRETKNMKFKIQKNKNFLNESEDNRDSELRWEKNWMNLHIYVWIYIYIYI
jgi:hypothetical protein